MREPYGITIFCDDIRHEMGGKLTYVGVYHQTMNVGGTPPLVLPMLHFSINLMIPSDYDAKEFVIKVLKQRKNDDKEETIIELPPQKLQLGGEPEKFQRNVIVLNVSPLLIDGDFILKVRAYFGDHEIRLGILNVLIGAASDSKLLGNVTQNKVRYSSTGAQKPVRSKNQTDKI